MNKAWFSFMCLCVCACDHFISGDDSDVVLQINSLLRQSRSQHADTFL